MTLYGHCLNIANCSFWSDMSGAIGILGGSFDPPHYGHIDLASKAMEKYRLEKVYWVPAKVSPFKQGQTHTPADHRLQMARLAVQAQPKFIVDECEIQREDVSYTIDTLRDFANRFPDKELYLIIGGDAVTRFHEWKDVDQFSRYVKIAVGSRPGAERVDIPGALFFDTGNLSICSTELRQRLRNGEPSEDLIPKNILDYITENQLYLASD